MLTIDRDGGKFYRQLYDQLRAEIETGVRQPGQALPSTRFLATQLALSRNTVDHAYALLVAEGFVVSRAGAAYRVARHLPLTNGEQTPEAVVTPTTLRYDFTERVDFLRLFPKAAWQAAESRVLHQGIEHIQPANGDLAYRQQLVRYLARLKQVEATPAQLVVVSGFNEAAALIAHLVPALGEGRLAVAEPIAPNASGVWQTLGVATTRFRDGKTLPEAAGYLLAPTHNFPDGAGLNHAARQALAAQLQAKRRYFIELDTDGAMVYDGLPTPAVHHFLHGERCFYYTNFDETLGSSLCAGVLVMPQALVPRYQAIYGQLPNRNSQLQQRILAGMLANDDLARYLRQLTIVYANRRKLVVDTVAALFGPRLTPMGTAAGSFVQLRVASATPVATLLAQAAAAGVGLVDPDRCWQNLTPPYPSVLLSFRQASDDDIVAGLKALAAAWQHSLV